MLLVAGNMLLEATKLLPVCCPSIAVYKGIYVAEYRQHVAGNKQHVAGQHVVGQHVAWCERGFSYFCFQ